MLYWLYFSWIHFPFFVSFAVFSFYAIDVGYECLLMIWLYQSDVLTCFYSYLFAKNNNSISMNFYCTFIFCSSFHLLSLPSSLLVRKLYKWGVGSLKKITCIWKIWSEFKGLLDGSLDDSVIVPTPTKLRRLETQDLLLMI